MISKELLSEVLGKNIESFDIRYTYIVYKPSLISDLDRVINTYELAHRSDRQALLHFDKKIFKEECESIFKSCQWILDNKEK